MPGILSPQTQSLIQSLRPPLKTQWALHSREPALMSDEAVLDWLKNASQYTASPAMGMTLERIKAAMLHDFYWSLLTEDERAHQTHAAPTRTSKIKFIVLTILGALFAFCEGYDGISSLLGLLSSGAGAVSFVIAFACALVSVLVFAGFELNALSQQLGVSLKGIPRRLNVLVEQASDIVRVQEKVNALLSQEDDLANLKKYREWMVMLMAREDALAKEKAAYDKILSYRGLIVAKKIAAVLTGGLYFSSGFFAGQVLALAIASLVVGSVSVVCWPVLLVSIGVGVAALLWYYFLQGPALENLVGRIIGVDRDKINQLPGPDRKASEQIKAQIDKRITDKETIQSLEARLPLASVSARSGHRFFPAPQLITPPSHLMDSPCASSVSLSAWSLSSSPGTAQ